ncbi:hypothetical protein BE20_01375 [Sorangium cellulosum]|nr:hypothetical protein BE20_01375 [Sorangium cellulosum]
MCGQGRFVSVPGLAASQNINAMWLIVDEGRRASPPSGGCRSTKGCPSINKWNTRVLDIDADGAEEILVYESNAGGGRIKVIDFNRDGVKNLIGPDRLAEAEEGPGLKHALQYATSTDESIRTTRGCGRCRTRRRW